MKKVWVPGSKSISNRVLLLAALSDRPIVLANLLESDDTVYMRKALSLLGAKIENLPQNKIKVSPLVFPINRKEDLFIGNAGTAARFLSCVSLLLSESGSFCLDGIARMQERPQKDLFEALSQVGVTVEPQKKEGFLPAIFSRKNKETGRPEIAISGKVSSQFLSGLLLVSPRLEKGLSIVITDDIPSWPYVEMTVNILQQWGVSVEVSSDRKRFEVEPGIKAPAEYLIPSDMSSASYPVLWSLLKKEVVSIENFGQETLQGDEGFLALAERAGAVVRREGDRCIITPPEKLQSIGDFDWSAMPDVSMTGMVLASCVDGESIFTGLESLRVKECDRIEAMSQLREFGIDFKVDGDDVIIKGNSNLIKHNEALRRNEELPQIDSFDDHRIAMCFGVLRSYLGLGADTWNQSYFKISEPECVAKTWPNFWLDLSDWEEQLRSVSAIIVKHNEKYLVVKKPRKDFAWQFPQGGVDGGENFLQAAKRELREECGSDLMVKFKGERPIGSYRYIFPEDFVRHDENIIGASVSFFIAEYVSGDVLVDQDEIVEYTWVSLSEMTDLFEPSYLENVQNFCN